MCVCILLGVVPTTKGIAKSLHLAISNRLLSDLFVLVELRCVIGCTRTVLVKDKPVALGSIHRELNAAINSDAIAILIEMAIGMSLDMATTLINVPSGKVMSVILRCIDHVYGIRQALVLRHREKAV